MVEARAFEVRVVGRTVRKPLGVRQRELREAEPRLSQRFGSRFEPDEFLGASSAHMCRGSAPRMHTGRRGMQIALFTAPGPHSRGPGGRRDGVPLEPEAHLASRARRA